MNISLQERVSASLSLIKDSLKGSHGKVILFGLLIGLIYFPTWLRSLAVFTYSGAIFPFATVGAAYVGLSQLWHHRQNLSKAGASPTCRKLGQCGIWFGIALFPFCQDKVWAQAVVWSLILTAIATSIWGLSFFRRYWIPVSLILLSTYPSSFLSLPRWIWQFTMPPETLERFIAWSSGGLLALTGYPVAIDDINILLPTGGVSVYYGCNGFDLMATMFSVSCLIGIVFQLSWPRTLLLTLLGITLALSLNLSRVALMAIAVAYLGENAFEFLHGFWGGQIFAGILFTVYYYLVLWMLPKLSVS